MKANLMRFWKGLKRSTQGAILIMVSLLFLGWGVFGQVAVDRQTQKVLEGVHLAVDRSFLHLKDNQTVILQELTRLVRENRGFACSIAIPLDHRTPKKIRHCFKINGAEPPRLP